MSFFPLFFPFDLDLDLDLGPAAEEKLKTLSEKNQSYRLLIPPLDRQQRREVVLIREARPPGSSQIRVGRIRAMFLEGISDDGVLGCRGGVLPGQSHPLMRFPPCLLGEFPVRGVLHPPGVAVAVEGPVLFDA